MNRARRRLQGLTALVALLAVVAGVPWLLTTVGSGFLPHHLPSGPGVIAALTSPDDGSLALAGAVVLAWAAWATFTASVLLDVLARLRRTRAPRIRGLRLPQATAHRLVGATILLVATGPIIASAASAASAASPSVPTVSARPVSLAAWVTQASTSTPASAVQSTQATVAPGQARAESSHAPTPPATTTYRVRQGDSLWRIARKRLGSGTRYPQIYDASRGVRQPGGRTLTDPDEIYPGWTLTIPTPGVRSARSPHGGVAAAAPDAAHGHTAPLPSPTAPSSPAAVAGPAATSAMDATPTVTATSTPAAAPPVGTPPTTPAHPATTTGRPGQTEDSDRAAAAEPGDHTPEWVLTGLAGAGGILAGSMFLGLRGRRRSQSRYRRPGRVMPAPPPVLAPVDMTVAAIGGAAAPTVELMDGLLRRLAASRAAVGESMPAVAAVELTATAVVLHLRDPMDLPGPWQGEAGRLRWSVPQEVDLEAVGPLVPGQPAPYPLLVTVGAGHDGQVWLLNLEDQVVQITGDVTYGRDLARYMAAEVACNPWSSGVLLDCVGVAGEVAAMDARRITVHDRLPTARATLEEVLADAVHLTDRARHAGVEVVTARAAMVGADAWGARLLLLDAAAIDDPDQAPDCPETSTGTAVAWATLLGAVGQPAGTGTGIVVRGEHAATGGAAAEEGYLLLHVDGSGRLRLPQVGLDLVAVGLTPDEARGCAAQLAQADDVDDVAVPHDPQGSGWRSWADETGRLLPEHTRPRDQPDHHLPDHLSGDRPPADRPPEDGQALPAAGNAGPGGDDPRVEVGPARGAAQATSSLLPAPAGEYVAVAATTDRDVDVLAPRVDRQVRGEVEDDDPDLDADVAAWFADDCDLPRLSVLGPLTARAQGRVLPRRTAYFSELLAFLAFRPHGATVAEVAEAFAAGRVREDVKILREWLGVNPRTGRRHLPDAREAAGARARGIPVYQVEDLLVDADLFRRLRVRGQARGADGIADLVQALRLVTGAPFEQLRGGGGAWLYEGDRIDQHLLCAVVDVAHLVTVHALHAGDLRQARWAAETAVTAAPHEEIPRLDLVAVTAAEGRAAEARRILLEEVCNRSDDGQAPPDLPPRTSEIIDAAGWLAPTGTGGCGADA